MYLTILTAVHSARKALDSGFFVRRHRSHTESPAPLGVGDGARGTACQRPAVFPHPKPRGLFPCGEPRQLHAGVDICETPLLVEARGEHDSVTKVNYDQKTTRTPGVW